MKISVLTETGINKKMSEDAVIINNKILIETFEDFELDQLRVVGIADGVGGNAGGKEAARFLLEKLAILGSGFDNEKDLLRKLKRINEELIQIGKETECNKKMATVFSGIIAGNDRYYLVHIGNTRIYVLQGRFWQCITEDQTMKALYERNGNFEVADKCNCSEIYGCFGGGDSKRIIFLEISEIESIMPGNSILLTSDGIHEFVSVNFLEKICSANLADKVILREISNEALKNGSRDDRSVVIIHL